MISAKLKMNMHILCHGCQFVVEYRHKYNRILSRKFIINMLAVSALLVLCRGILGTDVCVLFSSWQQVTIGSTSGLASNTRQAIIWTNGCLGYWVIYASIGFRGITLICTLYLKFAHGCVVLCFVVVPLSVLGRIMWFIYPYAEDYSQWSI